ncbi:alpha/beta hydrolase, partial [Xanthomonas citri pv. citri]|nr:alpha/beta hydrolase [Xanthomonas citri pv. citri]
MGVKSVRKIFVIITTLLAVAIIIGSIIMVVFSQRQAQTLKIQQQQFVKKPIPT